MAGGPLTWWDKLRSRIHGNAKLVAQNIYVNILSGVSPYVTDYMQNNFGQLTLLFRARQWSMEARDYAVDIQMVPRALKASTFGEEVGKGPDGNFGFTLFSSPHVKLDLLLQWKCKVALVTHYVHHLPEFKAGHSSGDIFDSFRAQSLRIKINMSVSPSSPKSGPHPSLSLSASPPPFLMLWWPSATRWLTRLMDMFVSPPPFLLRLPKVFVGEGRVMDRRAKDERKFGALLRQVKLSMIWTSPKVELLHFDHNFRSQKLSDDSAWKPRTEVCGIQGQADTLSFKTRLNYSEDSWDMQQTSSDWDGIRVRILVPSDTESSVVSQDPMWIHDTSLKDESPFETHAGGVMSAYFFDATMFRYRSPVLLRSPRGDEILAVLPIASQITPRISRFSQLLNVPESELLEASRRVSFDSILTPLTPSSPVLAPVPVNITQRPSISLADDPIPPPFRMRIVLPKQGALIGETRKSLLAKPRLGHRSSIQKFMADALGSITAAEMDDYDEDSDEEEGEDRGGSWDTSERMHFEDELSHRYSIQEMKLLWTPEVKRAFNDLWTIMSKSEKPSEFEEVAPCSNPPEFESETSSKTSSKTSKREKKLKRRESSSRRLAVSDATKSRNPFVDSPEFARKSISPSREDIISNILRNVGDEGPGSEVLVAQHEDFQTSDHQFSSGDDVDLKDEPSFPEYSQSSETKESLDEDDIFDKLHLLYVIEFKNPQVNFESRSTNSCMVLTATHAYMQGEGFPTSLLGGDTSEVSARPSSLHVPAFPESPRRSVVGRQTSLEAESERYFKKSICISLLGTQAFVAPTDVDVEGGIEWVRAEEMHMTDDSSSGILHRILRPCPLFGAFTYDMEWARAPIPLAHRAASTVMFDDETAGGARGRAAVGGRWRGRSGSPAARGNGPAGTVSSAIQLYIPSVECSLAAAQFRTLLSVVHNIFIVRDDAGKQTKGVNVIKDADSGTVIDDSNAKQYVDDIIKIIAGRPEACLSYAESGVEYCVRAFSWTLDGPDSSTFLRAQLSGLAGCHVFNADKSQRNFIKCGHVTVAEPRGTRVSATRSHSGSDSGLSHSQSGSALSDNMEKGHRYLLRPMAEYWQEARGVMLEAVANERFPVSESESPKVFAATPVYDFVTMRICPVDLTITQEQATGIWNYFFEKETDTRPKKAKMIISRRPSQPDIVAPSLGDSRLFGSKSPRAMRRAQQHSQQKAKAAAGVEALLMNYFKYIRVSDLKVRVTFKGSINVQDLSINLSSCVLNRRLLSWDKFFTKIAGHFQRSFFSQANSVIKQVIAPKDRNVQRIRSKMKDQAKRVNFLKDIKGRNRSP
eukprot:941418_1